jgi:hypothetical protein
VPLEQMKSSNHVHEDKLCWMERCLMLKIIFDRGHGILFKGSCTEYGSRGVNETR